MGKKRVLVGWTGSNEFTEITDYDSFVDGVDSLTVNSHVKVRSPGDDAQYAAHVWAIYTNPAEGKVHLETLQSAINSHPWTPKICVKYGEDHCSSCISIQKEPDSDESGEIGIESGSKSAVEPGTKKRKLPEKAEKAVVKKAEIVAVASNPHTIPKDIPLPQVAVGIDFQFLASEQEKREVLELYSTYKTTGKVPEPSAETLGDKLLQRMANIEKSMDGQLRSLHIALERVEGKVDTLVKDKAPKGIKREPLFELQTPSANLQSMTPASTASTPMDGVVSVLSDQYLADGVSLFKKSPATLPKTEDKPPQDFKTPSHTSSITGSAFSKIACNPKVIFPPGTGAPASDNQQLAIHDPSAPEKVLAIQGSAEPASAIPTAHQPVAGEVSTSMGAEVGWAEISETYALDPTAQRMARDIDWSDEAVSLLVSDPSSPIHHFARLVYKSPTDRGGIVRHGLRHIFPPRYFVGRNCTGQVPSGCKPKKPIQGSVLRILFRLSEYILPKDPTTEKQARSSVNKWLRDPTFLKKMARFGLND